MVNIRIVNTLNAGGILNFTFYSRFLRSLACSCFVGSDDMVEFVILMSEAVQSKRWWFFVELAITIFHVWMGARALLVSVFCAWRWKALGFA